ncbi:hypothetical protein ACFVR6_07405 [Microbacterium sp. NPDC058021]|uniref:hypothetical protein n=1 Tax=Microbacterium sp. NPDC058021 TaxID=3346306 RepID=UPI0036D7F2DF
MESGEVGKRRLRFYGAGDYATYWQVDEAVEIVRRFDDVWSSRNVADVIELHNAQQLVQAGFVPQSLTDIEKLGLAATSSRIRSSVARFFTSVDSSNLDELIDGVPFEYHTDLLVLLGNNRAFERCDADQMLSVLTTNGIHLRELLGNKKLVRAYDLHVREVLLRDPRNAELLIQHHFMKDRREELHIPPSVTPADTRVLMSRYVQIEEANPNYVRLIETAPISQLTGVDARLKLEAKRRHERQTEAVFKDNPGVKSGVELSISDDQDEPVITALDGMVATYSYSRKWLEHTMDYASVLNNFQHLFEFADRDVLLTLPAYRAELGVFERFFTTTGHTDYQIGAAYRIRDMSSTLQTQLAFTFLGGSGIELESVVSWFFQEYLPAEFDAHGFTFSPSAKDSSFLEKTRHLLVEMESVVRQFGLYVEDGEIDRELLAIVSDTVRYKQVPSLVKGKYLYSTDNPEIRGVLDALFSDQSSMTYISEEVRGDDLAEVLIRNQVTYEDFADHQRPILDHLVALEVLSNNRGRIEIASPSQFLILRSIYSQEAASYVHLSGPARALADEMVDRGWLRMASTLLTSAEASYLNYQLNKAEFSNGPELRNKYLHGSQADAEGRDAHFGAYLATLKLTIALVIKINDDFATVASAHGGVSTTRCAD